MAKIAKLSEGALKALDMIKASEGSVTAADLKKQGFEKINSAHLKALENRGLVQGVEVTKYVVQTVKRNVKEYTVTPEGLEFKSE